MWINESKDLFLLRDMPFRNTVVSDQESYRSEVFAVAESSFNHIDLYREYESGLSVMLVTVFASNYTFEINGEKFDVSFGDCLITTSPESVLFLEQEFILIEIEFYFSEQKKQIGSGSNKYSILSVVRDEYSLEVFADTEEEALEIAKTIPPSKWKHLEIDTHLEERTMVRMARWGNFIASEAL